MAYDPHDDGHYTRSVIEGNSNVPDAPYYRAIVNPDGSLRVSVGGAGGSSITVDQGAPNASPANGWYMRLTNGTSIASVLATDPTNATPALVVRNIPWGTYETLLLDDTVVLQAEVQEGFAPPASTTVLVTGGLDPSRLARAVATTTDGKVKVVNNQTHSATAAFGASMVAQEVVKVALSFQYLINSALVTSTTANGGTVTQSNGKAVLATSTATNGSAKMESRDAIKYIPGQGIACRFTAVFTAGVANSRQEIGIGDDNDGFFFGYNGTSFGVCRRRNGSDTWVARADWNGEDKFDGTGPSGVTLNTALGTPYMIRYQFLGFGAIHFYIENPLTGEFVRVHTIQYANTSTDTSVFGPTFPLHAKVINTGNNTNLTLQTPSMAAIHEGIEEENGGNQNVRNSSTAIKTGVGTTLVPLFSIQNPTTWQTINNRISLHIDNLSARAASLADQVVQIVLNPSLTGASFADVSTNTTPAQVDTAATAMSGGTVIWTMSLNGGTTWSEDLSTYEIKLRPGDILTVGAFVETGTGTSRASLQYHAEF